MRVRAIKDHAERVIDFEFEFRSAGVPASGSREVCGSSGIPVARNGSQDS